MTTTEDESLTALTGQIINAAFEVSNTLGCGFLEKVYERGLLHELKLRGLTVESQTAFPITYKGQCLGDYHADILVSRQSRNVLFGQSRNVLLTDPAWRGGQRTTTNNAGRA